MTVLAEIECLMWPLKWGETLSNHDWYPFPVHKFMGSKFVANCCMKQQREHGFTAMLLWNEAIRSDPAGTLPIDDMELASLARYSDLGLWLEHKPLVLDGWVTVHIDGESEEGQNTRLGNPYFLQPIVKGMYKRKQGRDGAREAGAASQRKSRIRKKMREMKVQNHIIESDQAVGELSDYFAISNLYITPDNVRTAMVEVLGYTGEIKQFPKPKGR